MAKKLLHVWGIEIGQSGLKALRCHWDGNEVIADTFDFIEYPKILSQPDSEPEKLIADALAQFISRNDLRHCKVGVSVPGQSGLSKFFKPPPVEVKKIADIVRYEAKQQIPFDLNDVIWDFQQMAGSNIEDGYALESEVGLFAMKKEAVFRALKPFKTAGIDVDLIQLAPMSVYNMLAFDRFSERLATETFDPEHPPKSTVLLSMGTDASDLIVTNGFRVWQRSMPIGGNHFTRQLTKDLKLTFAKAEHLKRNAMQADDPKLIFQAMRPVFNDLVTEIQRSIGFFKSLNKKAEIESVLLLGNTVKLPGLQPFLNKNLGFEVETLEKFARLQGTEVTGAPAFKENQLAFGVVYGLCLQLLGRGPISTNLVPREIVIERIVRAKKPWAVLSLAALMLGFVANFFFFQRSASGLAETTWKAAEDSAKRVKSASDSEKQEDDKRKNQVELLKMIGGEVSSNTDRRILWLELLSAIQGALNRDPNIAPDESPEKVPYTDRPDFHFTRIDSLYQEDLATWFNEGVAREYERQKTARENNKLTSGQVPPPKPAAEGDAAPAADVPADAAPAITGPGWIVEIDAYHYYNGRAGKEKEEHVYNYLLEYLENGTVTLPDEEGKPTTFTLKELGISKPRVVIKNFNANFRIPNPEYYLAIGQPLPGAGMNGSGSEMGSGGGGGKGMGLGMGSSDMEGSGSGFGSGSGTGPGSKPEPRDKMGISFQKILQHRNLLLRFSLLGRNRHARFD